ncbi:MAG TPA: hypothetical protein VF212_13130 [Longimicrobiales bacterium]
MLRRSLFCTVALVASVALVRCGLVTPTGVVDVRQVQLSLELSSEEVVNGATVAAEVRIRNTGTTTAAIQVTESCLADFSIVRDGVPQAFRITPAECWAVDSPLMLDPGELLRREWTIEVVTPSGAAVPEGQYIVRVEMNGRLEGGSEFPDVVRPLTVVEP